MSGRRLDAVLRVRALREQLARGEVATRRAEFDARQRAEAAALSAIRDVDPTGQLDARQFVGQRNMLSAGAREVDDAGEATGQARTDLHHASDHWQQTARRLDGIERLVDRLTADELADEQRREANDLDDLVVMRWPQPDDGVIR